MPAHALIIDDDKASIEVLAQLLAMQGASHTAVSKPTKLGPADAQRADVIFLDLEMRGMNGYEMLERLRNEFGVTAPIIAYTVNTNEKATARRLGFTGMLEKPLDASCFPDHLRRILGGDQLWDAC